MRYFITHSRSGHYTVTARPDERGEPIRRYVKISDIEKARMIVANLKAGKPVEGFILKTMIF